MKLYQTLCSYTGMTKMTFPSSLATTNITSNFWTSFFEGLTGKILRLNKINKSVCATLLKFDS